MNVDATNPPKSVIIPPPRFIIRSLLLNPDSIKNSQILSDVSIFLVCSPDLTEKFNTLESNTSQIFPLILFMLVIKISRQFIFVFSSVRIKILLKF